MKFLINNKTTTKNSENRNSSLGSFLFQCIGDERVSVPFGCDQQNNNIDCSLCSIASATELAFKGNPGTVSGVSTDRRCYPVYIALRYLYGPVKLDWFSCYRSFQRTL